MKFRGVFVKDYIECCCGVPLKIQEYPHCDLLIYTIATVLNGSLTLSDLNDEERMEYNTAIIEWLERTADSQDERVRNSSVFILATKYVQMEKYEEANALLKKNS